MNLIFIGCILILIDITVNVGGVGLELLPDFIGYALILSGINKLGTLGEAFKKAKKIAWIMKYAALAAYTLEVFRVLGSYPLIEAIINGVLIGITMYQTYYIALGVKEIEKKEKKDLKGEMLFVTWKILVIVQVISFIGTTILGLDFINIVAMIISILFLMSVNDARAAYSVK